MTNLHALMTTISLPIHHHHHDLGFLIVPCHIPDDQLLHQQQHLTYHLMHTIPCFHHQQQERQRRQLTLIRSPLDILIAPMTLSGWTRTCQALLLSHRRKAWRALVPALIILLLRFVIGFIHLCLRRSTRTPRRRRLLGNSSCIGLLLYEPLHRYPTSLMTMICYLHPHLHLVGLSQHYQPSRTTMTATSSDILHPPTRPYSLSQVARPTTNSSPPFPPRTSQPPNPSPTQPCFQATASCSWTTK